jgi:hypothetical protein
VNTMTEHADYPHEPGYLWDCEACEAECFCTTDPGTTSCVHCAADIMETYYCMETDYCPGNE